MMSQGCVARSTFPMNIGSIDDEDLFSLDPTRNCHGQQSMLLDSSTEDITPFPPSTLCLRQANANGYAKGKATPTVQAIHSLA